MAVRHGLLVSALVLALAGCGAEADDEALAARVRELEAENSRLREELSDAVSNAQESESTPDEEPEPAETTPPTTETTEPATTEPATTEPDEPEDPPAEAEALDLLVDFGFSTELNSIGTRYTTVGALVENPNSNTLACGVQVQFSLLNEVGTPVETTTERIDILLPGETAPAASPITFGFQGEEPSDVSVEIVNVEAYVAGGSTLDDCDFMFTMSDGIILDVSDLTIVDERFGRELVGQVTNPTDDVLTSFLSVDCVLFAEDGSIVGGESTGIMDPIASSGTIAFSTRLSVETSGATSATCRVYG